MAYWKEKELRNNMEYVYLLQATEAQYQKMMKFLDGAIRKDGLEAIQDVVDIYNVLVSGRKMPLYEEAAQSTLASLEETEQPVEIEKAPVPEEESTAVLT
jgi:hypothetical protein